LLGDEDATADHVIQSVCGAGPTAKIGSYPHTVRAAGAVRVRAGRCQPDHGQAGRLTIAEQASQASTNLATVADMTEFGQVNRQLADLFASNPPARMTMQVTLPHAKLI
jgi:hypothetical protein